MKLGRLLSLLAVFSCASYAQADLDAKFDGSGRVRYENRENKDFNDAAQDRSSLTGMRYRLGVTLEGDEDTSVYIQTQYTDTWGSNSGGLSLNQMSVFEAYLTHKISDSMELKLGRQALAYGDELILGSVGWSNVGRSFDAAKLKYKHSLGWVDVFSAEVGVTPSPAPTVRNNFSGVYASFTKFDFINVLDFYAFRSVKLNGVDDIIHAGLRAKSKLGSVDYRFEGTVQTKVTANQMDLELGYTLSEDSKMRVAVEAFTASKDYNQLYPTAHKWLGLADVLFRKNLNGLRLGFQMQATEKLNFKANYHMFMRNDDSVAVGWGGTNLGTVGTDKDIGSELDLVFNYKLGEKVGLLVGGSYFMAGDYLAANGGPDDQTWFFTQVATKF